MVSTALTTAGLFFQEDDQGPSGESAQEEEPFNVVELEKRRKTGIMCVIHSLNRDIKATVSAECVSQTGLWSAKEGKVTAYTCQGALPH